jgi:hypothetical protein
MIDIKEFIKRSKEERQSHLQLEEPCCERGGNSTNHKGVLAQFLNTSIPKGRILLCHACNNEKCSNPKHLYWGTDKENITEDNPKWKSVWDRTVEKYGYEKACLRNSRKGNTFGSGNKGKSKSEEHRKNIAKSIKEHYNKV